MRLLYLSQGNIPSRWAHTFQAMKMAEALAPLVDDFALVTDVHPISALLPRFPYERWYGVSAPFPIVELRSWRAPLTRLHKAVYTHRFEERATRFATSWGPDVVVTRHPVAAERCVERRLPTVVEFHEPPGGTFFPIIRRALERRELIALITISDVLRDMYVDAGAPRDRVHVLFDAVDDRVREAGALKDEERRWARTELGVEETDFVALYTGHLYPEKGVATLVEAARAAPEIRFAVVGGWEADVRRVRREASGARNLALLGFRPNAEMARLVPGADALLLPNSARHRSAQWTSPLKMFEYMGAQRPIVASSIPALQPVLRHERNALLVEPDDPEALVTALRRLRSDAPLGRRLAAQAFEEVKGHTWGRRARALLTIIRTWQAGTG